LENDLKEMREENCNLKMHVNEFNNFSIENGLLGLNRYVYLSIVKFLDSSILRKV
jgi:hypothetical protein